MTEAIGSADWFDAVLNLLGTEMGRIRELNTLSKQI
jgi:hypothetical protein